MRERGKEQEGAMRKNIPGRGKVGKEFGEEDVDSRGFPSPGLSLGHTCVDGLHLYLLIALKVLRQQPARFIITRPDSSVSSIQWMWQGLSRARLDETRQEESRATRTMYTVCIVVLNE